MNRALNDNAVNADNGLCGTVAIAWLKFSIAVGALSLAVIVGLASLASSVLSIAVLLSPLWVTAALLYHTAVNLFAF